MGIISGGKVIEGAIARGGASDVSGNATSGYGPFVKAGALANGDFNDSAEKGAIGVDTTNGVQYTNTGTKAATVWTVTGTQA